MTEIPRYVRYLQVEESQLDAVRNAVDDVLENPCEVKAKGNGMYALLFYASELEYDIIADEIAEVLNS